jgi:hypothetical protein
LAQKLFGLIVINFVVWVFYEAVNGLALELGYAS